MSNVYPFARAEFRFQGDATDVNTVAASSSAAVYYTLPAERRLTGGELVVWNNQEEDYIQIDVVHPVTDAVLQDYCLKRWVRGSGQYLDLRPLAATVPAGVKIKVTYTASAVAGTRKFAVNLDLFEEIL